MTTRAPLVLKTAQDVYFLYGWKMCPMSLHKGILKGLTILLDALIAFYPHFTTPVYSLGGAANVFYRASTFLIAASWL